MISILIPAYNEEKSIGKVIDDVNKAMRIQKYEYEIIVVDDGSSDSTYQIVASKGAKVIKHEINKGLGAALTTGVLHSAGEIIVIIDADCTYPAESIPGLLKEMEDNDMAIGARNQEYGPYRVLRILVKSIIRMIASYFTRTKIPDLNSGLRAIRKSIILKYKKYLPNTPSWSSTITIAMLYN